MGATPKVAADTCSDGDEWRGETGVESDVYECLVYMHLRINCISFSVIFSLPAPNKSESDNIFVKSSDQ